MPPVTAKILLSCLFALFFLPLTIDTSRATDEFDDLERIQRLPVGDREIESAFRRTQADACEIVASGEPLEIATFTSMLTYRDRRAQAVPIPSTRRGLFSVGLEFDAADRANLPLLSRGQIVEYVDEHYVSIQGRVRRDLLDRQLYYHHRPIAVTAKYRGSRVSQPFEPIISNTVKDFHGLGLFVSEDPVIPKPRHFRTLVLIFRTPLLKGSKVVAAYEFVFVRGRETTDGQGLDSHVFVTSDNREFLHYLRGGERPLSSRQTTILGQIAITEFDGTGLYPKESAARNYRLAQHRKIATAELDQYCQTNGLGGGYGENLDRVLDAIIDEKLSAQSFLGGL